MAVLSDNEIAQVARGAGLSGDSVVIAVAVSLAESGGNPRAHNAVPPDNSYGLWQINMLGSMGPSRRAKYGLRSNDDLYDPATNARVMADLSNKGTNWRPWTTYTRGTYKIYLNRGKAAALNVGGSTGGVATTPVGFSSGITEFGERITDPAVWRKAGLYALGVVLIVFGIIALAGLNAGKIAGVSKIAKAVK